MKLFSCKSSMPCTLWLCPLSTSHFQTHTWDPTHLDREDIRSMPCVHRKKLLVMQGIPDNGVLVIGARSQQAEKTNRGEWCVCAQREAVASGRTEDVWTGDQMVIPTDAITFSLRTTASEPNSSLKYMKLPLTYGFRWRPEDRMWPLITGSTNSRLSCQVDMVYFTCANYLTNALVYDSAKKEVIRWLERLFHLFPCPHTLLLHQRSTRTTA